MDITKLSIEEIKALKCDIYETISKGQQNLQILNAELEKRLEEKKIVKGK